MPANQVNSAMIEVDCRFRTRRSHLAKILIVDDQLDEQVRDELRQSHDLSDAASLAQALVLSKQDKFDLLICNAKNISSSDGHVNFKKGRYKTPIAILVHSDEFLPEVVF